MAEVWFTADTHFSHRSMIEKGWRPQYSTVDEMNADIIDRWNDTVRPTDTVWHLGDFAMGRPTEVFPIVGKLHGTIHLIAGNHDKPWPGNRDSHKHQAAWIAAGFASVQAHARRRIGEHTVLLSHLPYDGDHVADERYQQWRLRDLGEPLLCGHVHTAWAQSGRQLNVGVDVRNFQPVSLGFVAQWLGAFPS